jgi:hypothetical protein
MPNSANWTLCHNKLTKTLPIVKKLRKKFSGFRPDFPAVGGLAGRIYKGALSYVDRKALVTC